MEEKDIELEINQKVNEEESHPIEGGNSGLYLIMFGSLGVMIFIIVQAYMLNS